MSTSKNPTAEIITIGEELLKGTTLNTNARFLAAELTRLGFSVRRQSSCRDREGEIARELGEALLRSEAVLLTGGLGPTPDDVTREAVAGFFGVSLRFSKRQYRLIRGLYARRGRKVPATVRKEAMFPANAVPLANPFGIALGFSVTSGGKTVVVLPGVPDEAEKLFRTRVAGLLRSAFPRLRRRPSLRVNLTGISEPAVMERLGRDFFSDVFDFGIYPHPGEISICLAADRRDVLARLRRKIATRLKPYLYGWGDASLSQTVGTMMARKKATLAAAESCTGGLFASEMTGVPGASRYFKGSVTAYDNRIKTAVLGVDARTILEKGAVSSQVARALAQNVRTRMGASVGIGITGIAGPAGGTRKKPVGTVYLAVSSAKKTRVWKEFFHGDRTQIQIRAAHKALQRLWEHLRNG
ncbi:MAG: CinA family nicotinamide mononucleotide deamidase-related protein [Candidatus Omnitrophota bacterium]|jgi:nicotinamide-nucleotide amidase